jgi:hypothetical protein
MAADGSGADQRRQRCDCRQSAHPHAALLMADFLLSPDGQGVLVKYYYGSGAKDYGFKKWRPEHGLTTDQYEKELTSWDKLLMTITRK